MYATGARIKEALTGFGIEDKMMGWLDSSEMSQFLQLDGKIKQLEHSLTLDNSLEGFRKIQETLTNARAEAELIKSEIASTSMRNDAFSAAGGEADKFKLASFQNTDGQAYSKMTTNLLQIAADIAAVTARASKGDTSAVDGGQLINLLIEQSAGVKAMAQAMQSSGSNLNAELALNSSASVGEMVAKVKEGIPGIEDLGLNLERVDEDKLRTLTNFIIRVADMKRGEALGIKPDKTQKQTLLGNQQAALNEIDTRADFASRLKANNFSLSESAMNRTTDTSRADISKLLAFRDKVKAQRDMAKYEDIRIAAQLS
jgi:hypothetical protein